MFSFSGEIRELKKKLAYNPDPIISIGYYVLHKIIITLHFLNQRVLKYG